MPMQSEGRGSKPRNPQSTRGGTTGSGGGVGAGDSGATRGPAADPGNQQSGQESSQQNTMPPSETDDDQYDQGTVQQAP